MSMDETALIALGCLVEEMCREALGAEGDLVFTEAVAEEGGEVVEVEGRIDRRRTKKARREKKVVGGVEGEGAKKKRGRPRKVVVPEGGESGGWLAGEKVDGGQKRERSREVVVPVAGEKEGGQNGEGVEKGVGAVENVGGGSVGGRVATDNNEMGGIGGSGNDDDDVVMEDNPSDDIVRDVGI